MLCFETNNDCHHLVHVNYTNDRTPHHRLILKVGLTKFITAHFVPGLSLTSVRAKYLRSLHELTINTKNRVSR